MSDLRLGEPMDPSEIESREKAKMEKKRNRKLKHKPKRKTSLQIDEQQRHQTLPPVICSTNPMILPPFYPTLRRPYNTGFTPNYSHPTLSDCANLFSVFLRGLESGMLPRITPSTLAPMSGQNPILTAMLSEWTRRVGIDTKYTEQVVMSESNNCQQRSID